MKATAVVDLSYGDSGKGSIVDYLTRVDDSDLTIRFNGGPQASHHVVLPNGIWHGFSQFGSGTFVGAHTHLSRFMLIEPYALMNEAEALAKLGIHNPLSMLSIDPRAVVITPWHWKMNRIREDSRDIKHGSCGIGVGEARNDEIMGNPTLRIGDLLNTDILKSIRGDKLSEVIAKYPSKIDYMAEDNNVLSFYKDFLSRVTIKSTETLEINKPVIFEGAQGVLIDEFYGWAPYHTFTNTTSDNAITLAEGLHLDLEVMGLVPFIMTRHGAGPFVSHYPYMQVNTHNTHNKWQGTPRFGYMDMPALRYALKHSRTDYLAVTHYDSHTDTFVKAYSTANNAIMTDIPDEFTSMDMFLCMPFHDTLPVGPDGLDTIAAHLGKPVNLVSMGPTYSDKYECKSTATLMAL